nr:MAG TPA: hypothetical protein [Caudoviricetes sp.]
MYNESNATILNNKYTFVLTHIYHDVILYNSTLIQSTTNQYIKHIHQAKHNYTIKNTIQQPNTYYLLINNY